MNADHKGPYSPCTNRIKDTVTPYAPQIPSQQVLVVDQAGQESFEGFAKAITASVRYIF